jgi:hypothetical protein
MNHPWKKFVSGSIATALIAWACFVGGTLAGIEISAYEVVGLILIWNSDDLGDSAFPTFIMGSTPGVLVNIGGWIALLFPIIIIRLGAS